MIAQDDPDEVLLWGILIIFLAGTVAFLYRRGVKRVSQIGISVAAFVAIATASPGPFQTMDDWDPLYATVAVALIAAVLVVFKPGPMPEE